jgi:hypothetical protein
MERGNLAADAKGVRTSGKHPRGESTDAAARGGLGRSSDEALVMRVERRAKVIQFHEDETTRHEEDFIGQDKAETI